MKIFQSNSPQQKLKFSTDSFKKDTNSVGTEKHEIDRDEAILIVPKINQIVVNIKLENRYFSTLMPFFALPVYHDSGATKKPMLSQKNNILQVEGLRLRPG